MKKTFIFLLYLNVLFGIWGNQILTDEYGKIKITIPSSDLIQEKYGNPNKIYVTINTVLASDIKDKEMGAYSSLFWDIYSKNNYIYDKDKIIEAINLNDFNKTGKFIISDTDSIDYLKSSYEKVVYKDNVIGESSTYISFMDTGYNEKYNLMMEYELDVVLDDRIITITVGLVHFPWEEIIKQYPQWFILHDNNEYFWKNIHCLEEFYSMFKDGDNAQFPEIVKLFGQIKNMILDSIQIKDEINTNRN